jgi:hypothetical protein
VTKSLLYSASLTISKSRFILVAILFEFLAFPKFGF